MALADGKAANFRLLDHKGVSHELYYHSDKKAIVLIWQGNGCPIVRQYYSRIMELKNEYEQKDMAFFLINANLQDDRQSIAKELKEYNSEDIPVLIDNAQIVTREFEVDRTATVLVIDPEKWKVIYRGAIDDRLGYEVQKEKAEHEYLKDALDRHLKGKKVRPNKTEVNGCAIYLEDPGDVTYVDDIAPILKRRCVSCHKPEGFAPWGMDNYRKVKGWSAMTKEVVMARRMPPYNIDPNHPLFINENFITTEEVQKLFGWFDQKMPRGKGEDPLESIPDGDNMDWPGKPDHIFSIQSDQVPADGPVPYVYRFHQLSFEKDVWIRGVYFKPSNPQFVHHILAILVPPVETLRDKDLTGTLQGTEVKYIGGYLPNLPGNMFPEGVAMKIPAGKDVMIQTHYYPTGRAGENQTKIGFYFYDGEPDYELKTVYERNRGILIPAGDPYYEASAELTIEEDLTLLGLMPHMHYRGKSMRFTFDYPDGRNNALLSVPDYNFNWQHSYFLDEPIPLPQGTVVRADAVFDNSKQNPFNPDPDRDVGWGLKSEDEMLWFFVYALKDL